jgi:3-oxoacyl-[acyl-carrier protein] reductase
MRALVLGGSGAVGGAVVRALRARGVDVDFTFLRSREAAEALERLGARAHAVDLADPAELAAFMGGLGAIDALIHCAGVLEAAPALELDDARFERAHAINARSAFVAAREAARGMVERGRGSITLVGALDRAQSLPIPVAFASAQGLLGALVMSLAKEVGPRGVRVNLAALGLLDRGLSLGLSKAVRDDFLAYSALRRFATPDEVADPIVWLALDDTYMNGKVLTVNGGI